MSFVNLIFDNEYASIILGISIFIYCFLKPELSISASKILINGYFKLSILMLIIINSSSDPILSMAIGLSYLFISKLGRDKKELNHSKIINQ